MKIKIKCVLVVFFLCLFVFALAEEKQKAGWKGKIKIENGIEVIKNPKNPMYGEIVFDLVEDLSIGREDDENYAFFRLGPIGFDKEGNIYVLDSGNHRIQVFDKDGNYLRTIGKKGQGPGEFMNLLSILFDSDGNLCVNQGRSMSIFDKNGEFKRSIPFSTSTHTFGVTPEGNIITSTSSYKPQGISYEIILLSSKGKKLKKITSFASRSYFTIVRGIRIGYFNHFLPRLYCLSLGETSAIYGYPSEYRLFKVNSSGEIISIIEKDEPPKSYTKKEKKQIIDNEIEGNQINVKKLPRSEVEKAYRFPSHKAFYYGLVRDDRGNVYVQRTSIGPGMGRELVYDLFNEKGYYVYRVIIDNKVRIFPLSMTIKDGCLYGTTIDRETGIEKVKRFRIRNWDEIMR